jgi:hypothetical protein
MPSNQTRDRKTGKGQEGGNYIQKFYIPVPMIYMLGQLYKKKNQSLCWLPQLQKWLHSQERRDSTLQITNDETTLTGHESLKKWHPC